MAIGSILGQQDRSGSGSQRIAGSSRSLAAALAFGVVGLFVLAAPGPARAATVPLASVNDFSAFGTFADGTNTLDWDRLQDITGGRARVDTELPGGGEKSVFNFGGPRKATYNSATDTCVTSLAGPVSLNVTDDAGADVADFVQSGTITDGAQTLTRWVGSSGGQPIIAGVGYTPPAFNTLGPTAAILVTTPAGTVHIDNFAPGRPSASNYQLPAACNDPSATIATPPDGAIYVLNQHVGASFSCAPGLSGTLKPGTAGCSGDVADVAPLATSTLGAHTLSVTATQTDDTTKTATSHYTVVPAPPGPAVKITRRPGQGNGHKRRGKNHRWVFKFNDVVPGVGFFCQLDKGAFQPCTSPKTYRHLKRGRHTFTVKSVDVEGHESIAQVAKFRVGKR
jgi:hypothetical protein